MVSSEDDRHQDITCGLQDIGGHIMKILLIVFQVVLCMHLEVRNMSLYLTIVAFGHYQQANLWFELSGDS